jgi:hypothetical protein
MHDSGNSRVIVIKKAPQAASHAADGTKKIESHHPSNGLKELRAVKAESHTITPP